MSERCNICNTRIADHSCYRCHNNVCSSCIDENDLICRKCRFSSEDEIEGMKIGYSSLKKAVNMPLFIVGLMVIIMGTIMIIASSQIVSSDRLTQRPGGFIYIFPFPLVFSWGSPDMITVLPLIVVMLALPIIMALLVFRKFIEL